MADNFYPFIPDDNVEKGHIDSSDEAALPQPSYPARIAVYDDVTMPPRVVVVQPKDIRNYLQEIQDTVYELMLQQGGSFAYATVRELVENYIHASFIEPTVSILDKGKTLIFSDQGPGIPNKKAAVKPSFTSATQAMKRYIRGVGSGFPTVEQNITARGGHITIEDNINHGTVVTITLLDTDSADNAADQTSGPAAADNHPAGNTAQMPDYTLPYQQTASAFAPYGSAYPPQALDPRLQGSVMYPAQPVSYPPVTYLGVPPQTAPSYQYSYAYPQAYQQANQGHMPGVGTVIQSNPYIQGYPQQIAATPDTSPHPMSQLTKDQLVILALFKQLGQVGTTEIKNHTGISLSTGTRRLQELSKKGLIYKPNNNKKYILTDEGFNVSRYL